MREAASFIARQTTAQPAGALRSLLDGAERVFRAWVHRRTVSRLIDLDDHLLADIGIARSDLRQALDQPFAFDPSLELQRIARRKRRRGWRGA
jgi:uncharacterized protein YjiS (DUF1127 family)